MHRTVSISPASDELLQRLDVEVAWAHRVPPLRKTREAVGVPPTALGRFTAWSP